MNVGQGFQFRWVLLLATMLGWLEQAAAVGIDDYRLLRSFSLPAPGAGSGGNVLYDALPDGRLFLLNGAEVLVELSSQGGTFSSLGTIPGFTPPAFGPSFMTVSPDGTRAAVGSNGAGTVVVFDTGNLHNVTSFAVDDFTGEWVDNRYLASGLAAPSGVSILDTQTGIESPVITNIGGALAGVAVDRAGNLYTGNSYSYGTSTSDTGWIKAFALSEWQNALATSTPLEFESSGTPVADLLSAYPIGFDASGNMFVGGADFFGDSGDFGYAALVDAGAVADALANPLAIPPIDGTSSAHVLRKFVSPQSTIDEFAAPSWVYNSATGELLLNYIYGNSIVNVYGVAEPGGCTLAAITVVALAVCRMRTNRESGRIGSPFAHVTWRQKLVPVFWSWIVLGAAVGARSANAQSPYATEIVAQNSAFGGAALYNDPHAVLGEPTRIASNIDPQIGTSPFRIKIVDPAYNVDLDANKVITTLSRRSDGAGGFTYGSITVRFDHPVFDDAANPYGIDFNVFGNSFYVHSGFADDSSDMRSNNLVGGIVAEPVVVSVSPDNVDWYTYSAGPYGDTAFPTQGFAWSADQHDATGNGWTDTPTDFTKPVNPTLNSVLGAPGQQMAAIDAIGTYVGSGGGTGFDLAESGFGWIQYVRVESTAQFRDGEIDAFADVRPMRIGDGLSITPQNVADRAPLHFQSVVDESRSAVLAQFNSVSDLAKLTTAEVTDATALAALPEGKLVASYELTVSPLIGSGEVTFSVDYQLLPGIDYVGDGSDIELVNWDAGMWNSVPFIFDSVTRRLQIDDWRSDLARFAIVRVASADPNGDYNRDGLVDTADYIVWRQGTIIPSTDEYYEAWRMNYGRNVAIDRQSGYDLDSVPEPATWTIGLVVGVPWIVRKRA